MRMLSRKAKILNVKDLNKMIKLSQLRRNTKELLVLNKLNMDFREQDSFKKERNCKLNLFIYNKFILDYISKGPSWRSTILLGSRRINRIFTQ